MNHRLQSAHSVVCLCVFRVFSIQMADEINEQMAQPIGPQMDEDELNAELEEMENELMDSQLLAAPDVPVATVKCQTTRRNTQATVARCGMLLPDLTICPCCFCLSFGQPPPSLLPSPPPPLQSSLLPPLQLPPLLNSSVRSSWPVEARRPRLPLRAAATPRSSVRRSRMNSRSSKRSWACNNGRPPSAARCRLFPLSHASFPLLACISLVHRIHHRSPADLSDPDTLLAQ